MSAAPGIATTRPSLPPARRDTAPESSLPNIGTGLGTLQSFEFTQRVAKMLSSSTLVPEQYRGYTLDKKDRSGQTWIENRSALPNCIIALNMAARMGADPLMVMQNLHVIEGRPAWSSQFVIAMLNSSGRFSPVRFDISQPGEPLEIEFEYSEWKSGDDGRRFKEQKKGKRVIRPQTCVAWVKELATGERLEGPEVSIDMAVAEGWLTRPGSKWVTMPGNMLRYRAAAFLGRLYAPDLLMGLSTNEEISDFLEAVQNEAGDFEVDTSPPQSTAAEFDADTGEIFESAQAAPGEAAPAQIAQATEKPLPAAEVVAEKREPVPVAKAETELPPARTGRGSLFSSTAE